MKKNTLKARSWMTFAISKLVGDALEMHRRKLTKERGVEVTKSDAARDAILRTKGGAS
jgi:hypothetical protein